MLLNYKESSIHGYKLQTGSLVYITPKAEDNGRGGSSGKHTG